MPTASIPAFFGADAALGAASAGAGEAAAVSAFSGAAAVPAAAAASSLPSILSTVGAVGAGLSGITGAVGAEESASATAASAKYQAQVAANNQQIAKQDAALAGAAGEQQVEQQGLKTKATVGAIKAAQAASNIDVNSGSAVDVRSSAAELGELNTLTTRANAAKQAYGYETEATSFAGQQSLALAQASQAPVAGNIQAAGSLLSGASGVANTYAKWLNVGGNSGATIGPLG